MVSYHADVRASKGYGEGHERMDHNAAIPRVRRRRGLAWGGREGACAYFRTGSFAAGARLVNAISELAGLEDHHPDVELRYDGVIVRLITITPDYYGLSERDLEVARQISTIARKLGVPADLAIVQTVQVTIDALDIPKVKPFWRAVLGYKDRAPKT